MKIFLFKKQFIFIFLISFIVILLSTIPLKLAIARYQAPLPQIIFTLGGGINREEFTAQFAQTHPLLPIWLSSGSPKPIAEKLFQKAGIDLSRVKVDSRATDTVTNFTTVVKDFQKEHIQHLYLITSSFHMRRAKTIATIVLGSHGITFTPVAIPSTEHSESIIKIVRDAGRALIWLVTGHTGASLNNR
jgi:uncharacterized SAM-binding protein YcdF (DUF218 family)